MGFESLAFYVGNSLHLQLVCFQRQMNSNILTHVQLQLIVRKMKMFEIPLYLAQWSFLSFREVTYDICLGSDALFMKPLQA